jgi:hypothetical protein
MATNSPHLTAATPVGQGPYVVRQGDCMTSIAETNGHFWETIWNDPANADLKRTRQNPNILLPGDRVTISPLRPKLETGETETRHRFRRRGVPAKLRLVIKYDEQSIAHASYRLDVDGNLRSGTTDSNGKLEEPIPGQAKRAKLAVQLDTEQGLKELYWNIDLGSVDPPDTVGGVQQRLRNLGFDCGPIDGILGKKTVAALRHFQEAHHLPVTGEADAETRSKLYEVHQS